MSQHRHGYFDVSDSASNLTSWIVRRDDLFPSTAEEGDANESEVAPFQPVYVIPHVAVTGLSQWCISHRVNFM